MAIMTAQLPLTLVPAGAIEIGQVAALLEDEAGGRVFAGGELVFAWDAGDDLGRRLAAVQLVRIKGARAVRVAEGFEVTTETLRRWEGAVTDVGVAALGSGKRGPKGPSRLSQEVVADIRSSPPQWGVAADDRRSGRGQRGHRPSGAARGQRPRRRRRLRRGGNRTVRCRGPAGTAPAGGPLR
jgi:hypothetical protein